MARHARKYCLEMLEKRRLLSQALLRPPNDVSVLANPKLNAVSVVGTIEGTYFVSFGGTSSSTVENYDGSGTLPVLGLVQLRTTIPALARFPRHGTMTLTTGEGTLTLAAVERQRGPLQLTVRNGTNVYAGWHGSGTVTVRSTISGYHRIFPDTNAFKLKLKP